MRTRTNTRGTPRFSAPRMVVAGCLVLCLISSCQSGAKDAPPRPGLRSIEQQGPGNIGREEAALIAALKLPLLSGKNVEGALAAWFAGREAAETGDLTKAEAAWQLGRRELTDLKNLPKADWDPPNGTDFRLLRRIELNGMDGVECHIATWSVDHLKQYGVFMVPHSEDASARFPLVLYLHGAAFGVPLHALPWLAKISRAGYAIVGPALRGEPLFSTYSRIPREIDLHCEGEIENLGGEVDDALSAVAGALKLPCVSGHSFAILAHSFGAGVGLLAAARSPNVVCAVSYDAWLVDPFRFYWDRMRRGANNWWSWESYCNQPVAEQLAGLMRRSVLHHADLLRCPLLLFIGGGYKGSVFHLSHEDLVARLTALERDVTYDVVPDGHHTFVLAYDSPAARYAFERHTRFLHRHFPPSPQGRASAKEAPKPVESQGEAIRQPAIRPHTQDAKAP
ncbi:MAG: hypothetical protein HN742_15520 [Lentisphaerae bacterium]|nr:hypothetical protein [Lentisphaerota bacterium]MBT4820908.1 hypothetical protein [Lentisphaerota bacterium]MBT5607008.1 hypothetical protein [Lentisphaerota bacterium]MBT7059709.1 hypothetical protein [Lentisphaerota bacterium]MBT7843286.1 hypothetical protein [Lentisphaerota bacterium]